MTFEEARAQFPVLERWRVPERGHERAARARDARGGRGEAAAPRLATGAAAGRTSSGCSRCATRRGRRSRACFGAPVENVALVYSTTDACNVVLAGLGLGPGDEIVTTDEEHFGMLGPLAASGARVRLAKTLGRPPDEHLDAILAEIGPRTRLLAISHVLVDLRQPAADRGAARRDRAADPRRRRAVGRRDRARRDGRSTSTPRRARSGSARPTSTGALYVRDPESLRVARVGYPSAESYEPDGDVRAEGGRAAVRHRLVAVARRWPACARRSRFAPSGRTSGRARPPIALRERLAERRELVTAPGQATLVSWRERGRHRGAREGALRGAA